MTEDLENNNEVSYKESGVEKNNKKISIIIFIIGLVIAITLCGIGFIRQNNANMINEEKAQQAYEQSQNKIDQANKRLEEINEEIITLQEQYELKKQEADSMSKSDSNWSANYSKAQREANNIYSQISSLESEIFQLQNDNYTVYYLLVEPITYMIFYYIAGGVFCIMSLIALIYFLVTRRK